MFSAAVLRDNSFCLFGSGQKKDGLQLIAAAGPFFRRLSPVTLRSTPLRLFARMYAQSVPGARSSHITARLDSLSMLMARVALHCRCP